MALRVLKLKLVSDHWIELSPEGKPVTVYDNLEDLLGTFKDGGDLAIIHSTKGTTWEVIEKGHKTSL